ncbi:MAG TPA: FAD-dependent oxidoreductase [Bacillota bacterium]|nr:FAD-dependent oxidoreductase [Bacillota bacterium]
MSSKLNMPQFPKSYWRDSVNLPSFPRLNASIKTDVGIVGGGITGITAAYLLTQQGLNVVLIDAGSILNGTTGHTTAKITAQHGLIYDELINHFGEETASLYFQAATEAKTFIENTITAHDISCEYGVEDAYLFTQSEQYLKKMEKEKRAYERLGIPSEWLHDMPLDIPIQSALVMKNQAQFHPLQYLKTMVEEAVRNGLRLYENTTAVDVEYNKHPTIITRDEYRITCRYVIEASHYPFYDGQGFYMTRMYPERSYINAVKTPQDYPGGMYINAESPSRSIRRTSFNGDDLWLIVGENHKTGQGESTLNHYKALQQFAEKHFGISDYVYRWSAQDLTTLDKLPYIGPVTKGQQSVFVATGFRKWGMTNGTIAAKIISDLIINGSSPYAEVFTPSRFEADPAIRQFTTSNADVVKHLVKGKFEYADNNIENLQSDEATIIRINGERVGVYKDSDNHLYAVDTTCKHMGCEVTWNSGDRTWDCPCHGSRYKYTGEVVEGPAKEPLNKIDLT